MNKKMFLILLLESIYVIINSIYYAVPIISDTIPFYLSHLDTGKVSYIPGALYLWLGSSLNSGKIVLFAVMPILAAIPYGESVYMDESSHYIYQFQMRSKKSTIYCPKLFALFLSGGVIAAFPFALSFLSSLAILPMERPIASNGIFLGNICVFSNVFYHNPFLYVFIFLFLIFAAFGLLNCFCFIGSELFDNRFIVVIFPFAVDFIIYVIGEMLGGRNRTPWIYLNLSNMWKSDIEVVLMHLLAAIIIITAVFLYKCSKKKEVL